MIVGIKVGYSSPTNRGFPEGQVFGVLAINTLVPTNTPYIDILGSSTSRLSLHSQEVRKLNLHVPKRKHLNLGVNFGKVKNKKKNFMWSILVHER